ncbi:HAMP domain-containing histidine kinase [Pseudomonas sp. LPB0260]|uniref:sensor histidine kinase n=1 Tax=Pseudomonas sp. LPB0260 TaxID=2614442 RepID=UPI0015C24CF6|nr:HAMP domain-containing sensor histidine kinase [Pseudomonas sp. LPB0260]QLC73942.1 HAMP domain-containing histidine kinase [Pseudomonas sp. LPB0260]QLC76716.1 HAMP domain-containing histidine kinase [Pseudomonas sp. LPB0260]
MRNSIAFRLNALFVVLVTLLLGCSGALAYWSMRSQLLEQYQRTRDSVQQRLQTNLVNPLWNFDTTTLQENLAAELKPPVLGILVQSEHGEQVAAVGVLEPARSRAGDYEQLNFPVYNRGRNEQQVLGRTQVLLSRQAMHDTLNEQVWRRFLEILALDVLLVAALSLSLRLQVLKPLAGLRDALNQAAEHRGPPESLELPSTPLDEFGEVLGGFKRITRRLAEDLDARRQAEGDIRRAYEELQRAQATLIQAEKLAALGGLVAGVAHEINTPLGITLTGASVLAEQTRRFDSQLQAGQLRKSDVEGYLRTAAESVELILANANRAAHLVHSFKQVAVDQTSEARREFNLARYLDEVVESLRPTYKRLPIEVSNSCPADIQLDGYPGALAQVVTNLLVNAVTHAYPSGAAGRVELSARTEGEWVVLRFEDDGQGIAAEHLPHIFEPFFTTKRGAGGSGLGLHVVYNIVTQRLGGQIQVASTVGSGTCFTLHMPRTAPHPAEEAT